MMPNTAEIIEKLARESERQKCEIERLNEIIAQLKVELERLTASK